MFIKFLFAFSIKSKACGLVSQKKEKVKSSRKEKRELKVGESVIVDVD